MRGNPGVFVATANGERESESASSYLFPALRRTMKIADVRDDGGFRQEGFPRERPLKRRRTRRISIT